MFLFFVYNILVMKDYEMFYKKLSAPLKGHEEAVRRTDFFLMVFVFVSYPALLMYLLFTGSPDLFRITAVPAVSLVLISLLRVVINRKRPYDEYHFEPMIPKEGSGNSFPSRHVFSTAVIAMCFLKVYPPAGMIMFAAAAAEMYLRTAGGVHFPSDVIAGAFAGILAGLFLFL